MLAASPGGKKLKQAQLCFGQIQQNQQIQQTQKTQKTQQNQQTQQTPAKKPRLELENETKVCDAPPEPSIVVSDEEANDASAEKEEKVLNPFVKLVDVALKRKLKKKSKEDCGKKQKSSPNTRETKDNKKSENNSEDADDEQQEKVTVESKGNKHKISPDTRETKNAKRSKTEGTYEKEREDTTNNTLEEVTVEPDVYPLSDSEEEKNNDAELQDDLENNGEVVDDCLPSECDSENETNSSNSSQENDKEDGKNDNNENLSPKTPVRKNGVSTSKTSSEKKLTPRQLQKKMDSIKKREQREREKQEREHKKLLEQEEKNRIKKLKEEERQERERIKEEKRKEKEEKERIRRVMKELEETQKQKKKEEKEEERKKREELMEAEKRRKELEKEEIENKKKKAAAAFASFFVPKEKVTKNKDSAHNSSIDDSNHNYLSNFTIKSDMRLAPIVRNHCNSDQKELLDSFLQSQTCGKKELYLVNLKKNPPKSLGKTWPLDDLKNDLVIIEDDLPLIDDEEKSQNQVILTKTQLTTSRPKLIGFSENRRPPYWGTWTKKSSLISGRRPFAIDKTFLDYTCDSDDEWEEEEPGESVESVAGSDDEDEDNEYDVDNEFMVPHGYLSDEEALGEDDNAPSPETQKAKLKFLELEFEDEMKKTTKIKQPRIIGAFWQNSEGNRPSTCPLPIWDFLIKKMILTSEPLITIDHNTDISENDSEEKSNGVKKTQKISNEMIPDLLRLIHGNTNGQAFLVNEFRQYIVKKNTSTDENNQPSIVSISKRSIVKKMKELSMWMPCPEDGTMHTRLCWFVDRETREKYGVDDLKLPNEWKYTLLPKKRTYVVKEKSPTHTDNKEVASKEKTFNITKFTKFLTPNDKEKQFINDSVGKKKVSILQSGPLGKTLPSLKDSNVDNIVSHENQTVSQSNEISDKKENEVKKRVPLVSTKSKGKDTPKPVRTNLLTQFIKTASTKYNKNNGDQLDDCVVLSD